MSTLKWRWIVYIIAYITLVGLSGCSDMSLDVEPPFLSTTTSSHDEEVLLIQVCEQKGFRVEVIRYGSTYRFHEKYIDVVGGPTITVNCVLK